MGGFRSDEQAYTQLARDLKAMSTVELVTMQQHIAHDEEGHPDDEYARFRLEGLIETDEFTDALAAEIESRLPHVISC